jgi:hypothetical protein
MKKQRNFFCVNAALETSIEDTLALINARHEPEAVYGGHICLKILRQWSASVKNVLLIATR